MMDMASGTDEASTAPKLDSLIVWTPTVAPAVSSVNVASSAAVVSSAELLPTLAAKSCIDVGKGNPNPPFGPKRSFVPALN